MAEFIAIFTAIVLFSVLVATLRVFRPRRVVLYEYQRAALYVGGKLQRVLEPGVYWITARRHIQPVDVRIQALNVASQEILTADGLSLKITLVGEYRIADPTRYLLTGFAPAVLLYQDAQQALREVAAGLTFETLLETRAALNNRMLELLQPVIGRLGIEVMRIEIRDIILPGELKRAYAQVATAQKEGLAALERARGETAALRSLANAARLMQDHPGLLQLRAVQAIESSKGNTLTLELSGSAEKASS